VADNFFDQFDDEGPAKDVTVTVGRPAAQPKSNFFDQFDEATPIDKALAARDEEVAEFQARKQREFAARQSAIQAVDLANPNSPIRTNPLIAENYESDPYNRRRSPPLAPREEKPKQPLGSGFNAVFQSALVNDPDTKRKILADTLFPNDPDGIYRVGFDRAGQPVYVGDDGKLHKIASGTAAFGAQLLANAPETVGAGIGAFGGPGTAALIASGMHGLKRVAAGQIFDEPQTSLGNLKGMALEGGTTLIGEGVGRGINALGNAGRRIDLTPADIAAAERVRERVLREANVNLNLADASDDPNIKGIYAFGSRQPGPAARLLREDRLRSDREFHQQTERVLNTVARAEPSEQAGQTAVNAARQAIDGAYQRAQAIAAPRYDQAYAAMPRITDPELMRYFQLPGFGEAFEAGQRTAQIERRGLRPFQPPDLRSMDYMKRELDDMVRQLERTNPTQAGAMREQVGNFVRRLDEISPEYARARTAYRRAVRWGVTPLETGKVGVLARIDDPQARTAAAQVLSDTNVSAANIAQTRAILERQNPEAWNGLVRQWLASKWDDALERTQSGEVRNRAGKFQRLVFASPRDEELARAMLTPEQFHTFNELMFAAQRLASTPIGGSSTPHDLAVGKTLEGAVGRVVQVIGAIRHPVKTLEDATRARAREENLLDIVSAIVDPEQRRRLNVILRMRPGTQQAVRLGTIMTEEALKREAQTELAQGENSELIAGEPDALGEP
jgi:hypothetical protein